jgi:hypothetical protein
MMLPLALLFPFVGEGMIFQLSNGSLKPVPI